MAGSWNHIVDDEGRFIGTDLIDTLGDAEEALQECYGMVWLLADGRADLVADAAARWREGLAQSPEGNRDA